MLTAYAETGNNISKTAGLPGYPIPEFWVKLLMPKNRIEKPAALSLIGILKGFGQTILPQANG